MKIILENRFLRRFNRKLQSDKFGNYVRISDLFELLERKGIRIEFDGDECPLLRFPNNVHQEANLNCHTQSDMTDVKNNLR